MFTGIIEHAAALIESTQTDGGRRLVVAPKSPLSDLAAGESIAVNGVCLTVEPDSTSGRIGFFLSNETLSRTTLGEQEPGATLNIERSLRVGDRLGGHFVFGHVDAVGAIEDWREEGEAWTLAVSFPPELGPYITSKGSIGIDGISLTVVRVADGVLTVAVIPHTVRETNLKTARPGRRVNLEVDMLARYAVHAMMRLRDDGVSEDLLRRAGFLA
jgi:riboflavin synthase